MKDSIRFICDRRHSAGAIAQDLGFTVGENGSRLVGVTLQIPLGIIQDTLIDDLQSQREIPEEEDSSTVVDAEAPPPQRITRIVPLDGEARIHFLTNQANYLEAIAQANDDPPAQLAAWQTWQSTCRHLRDTIVSAVAELDCDRQPTLVYGATLNQAQRIFPNGQRRECHTLIHATHAESPEDLWLREYRIDCQRIISYRVPDLDDAAWHRNREPRRPITSEVFRDTAYSRLLADLL